MAENIYFDLSEDIQRDLEEEIQELCEEMTQTLTQTYGQLEEICRNTMYEPIMKSVNQTIELFDDEIHTHSLNAFEEWIDGDGSFKAAAIKSQAGDSAMQTAADIENHIRDYLTSFWSNHPMGSAITVDTSRPRVKDEDFDTLGDIYKDCAQKIEDISERTLASIRHKGEDDPTYNVILPAVTSLTNPIKAAFEKFIGKISESKDKSEELKQQQAASNEEALGTATQTTASAAEIADALKMFDNI